MTDSTDPHFQEWSAARDVIAAADANLDSIRRLGIAFVTSLLAIDGLLLPGDVAGVTGLSDPVKFAVLLATLLVLGGVVMIDRNYQVLQEAAATRALVLERELNLELTEVISQRYQKRRVEWLFSGIYVLIGAALLTLGAFTLQSPYLLGGLAAGVAAVAALAYLMTISLETSGGVDWSIDVTSVAPGDILHITATNLFAERKQFARVWLVGRRKTQDELDNPARHTLVLKPGVDYWKIVPEGDTVLAPSLRQGRVDWDVKLGPQQTYVWPVDTTGIRAPSILAVYASKPEKRPRPVSDREPNSSPGLRLNLRPTPLRRKIRLEGKSTKARND